MFGSSPSWKRPRRNLAAGLLWGGLAALATAGAVLALTGVNQYLAAALLVVAMHLTCICHKRMR